MSLKLLVIGFLAILLLAGCTQPEEQEGELPDSGEEPSPVADPGDDYQPPQDDDFDDSGTVSSERLSSPILCNDPIIVSEIKSRLGSSYEVTKGVPRIGQVIAKADCFVKKDNSSIITFNISEHNTSSIANSVLEDEKIQIQEQLFSYTTADSSIGSKGYLVEQPAESGPLYRLIFVDDTNMKVFIFIKSNVNGTPKSTVESVGRVLEEVI